MQPLVATHPTATIKGIVLSIATVFQALAERQDKTLDTPGRLSLDYSLVQMIYMLDARDLASVPRTKPYDQGGVDGK